MTIYNAEITGTSLGPEDHGIMTFFIYLKWEGGSGGSESSFGGYRLDWKPMAEHKVVPSYRGKGYQAIRFILSTLFVSKWEDLKGKYVKIDVRDGQIVAIGHIIHESWFNIKEYFQGIGKEE